MSCLLNVYSFCKKFFTQASSSGDVDAPAVIPMEENLAILARVPGFCRSAQVSIRSAFLFFSLAIWKSFLVLEEILLPTTMMAST